MHFTWSEREGTNGPKEEPEVDIVLFPGGGTFSKLPGRRMFILKHHDEKLFFWSVPCMERLLSAHKIVEGLRDALSCCRAQERDGGQDDQHCITVNECINSFTGEASWVKHCFHMLSLRDEVVGKGLCMCARRC